VADVNLTEDLRVFRSWAYAQNQEFGKQIDVLILDGIGLGSTISIGDALSKLTEGLADAAKSAQVSVQTYYDAKTAVEMMKRANAAGMTVDQYRAASAPGNVLGVFTGSGDISKTGAIPTWAILAGIGVIVFLAARK
jgi:hypothetical protein